MTDVVFNASVRVALQAFFGSGTFKAMLLTESYAPDKDGDAFRSDVDNEIAAISGYEAGGKEIAVSVLAVDNATDSVTVQFGPVSWDGISAPDVRCAVIYKALGGAASADPIIYAQDFDATFALVSETLLVEATTLRFNVPAVV